MHGELARLGVRCGRKRVARLMRESGLAGVHARRRWRKARSGDGRAPDLVQRNFGPAGPDQLWAADVTQFRTGEGWLYLAAVIDLWSRRAIGWSTGNSATTELVSQALVMAATRRAPGDPPLRPGSGLHIARVLAANHRTRATSVTGKDRRLLRQRRSTSLLRHPETRAGLDPPHQTMEYQRSAPHRPLRLHRGLLQPPAHPAQARASKPHRLRDSSQLQTPCPPKRVKPRAGVCRSESAFGAPFRLQQELSKRANVVGCGTSVHGRRATARGAVWRVHQDGGPAVSARPIRPATMRVRTSHAPPFVAAYPRLRGLLPGCDRPAAPRQRLVFSRRATCWGTTAARATTARRT